MNYIFTKKDITTAILTLVIALGSLVSINFAFSNTATAQTAQSAKEAVCQGIGAAVGGGGDCEDPDGAANVDSTLKRVIEILSTVVAVIAVIMMIIGGIKYVTSQGDSNSTSSARNTIIYALVGLVIVVLAQVIVRYVVDEASTAGDTNSSSPASSSTLRDCPNGPPC